MSANIPYMDGMGIVIASGYFFWTLVSKGETSEDDSQEVQYSIVLYCQQSGDFIPWSQPPFRKWWFLLDDDKLRLSTYEKSWPRTSRDILSIPSPTSYQKGFAMYLIEVARSARCFLNGNIFPRVIVCVQNDKIPIRRLGGMTLDIQKKIHSLRIQTLPWSCIKY